MIVLYQGLELAACLYVLIYRMRFNFRGVYISRICNFRVFKFADAGYSGVEIFAGEIFVDIQSESVYHNSIRQLQRCKTRWTRWIRMKMSSYRMESCIRGFHIYKEVWTPFIGERLGCVRERSNREDPFAVAMKRGNEVVGHVPRTISCVCTLFLRQRGSISCEVTGSRRRSVDLPQGGLELPCILTFSGPEELVDKLKMRIDEITQTKTGNSSAAVPTKGEETVPIEGEDTAVPIEGEDSAVPIEGEDTAVPIEGEDTAVPIEGEDTAVPIEGEDTAVPIEGEDTAVPTEGEDEALPIKVEEDSVCTVGEETEEVMANKKEEVWLSFKDIVLRLNDKHTIDCDQRLTDLHINSTVIGPPFSANRLLSVSRNIPVITPMTTELFTTPPDSLI